MIPETESTAAPEMATGLRARILVVDDEGEFRRFLRELFERTGYAVLEAADGPRALALAETERPDGILLDLAMPAMDGFEVLARLVGDPRTREIPVIIVTGVGHTLEDLERALQGGAVDYLTKPILPRVLGIRVQGAIERRRLLREIQELRARYTAMLVHDLRSPITAIKASADILAAEATEAQRRHLQRILGACDETIRLIDEILDLSRLEAGRLALHRRPVDVAAVAAEVAERYRPLALKKGVALAGPEPCDASVVAADPERLEQVITNLLENALKFTPTGGAVAVEVQDAGDALEVAVRDTGPGVPPEELPLLFEAFRQGRAGRAAGRAGFGLGLLICRHLVEGHGGRIWVESAPGRGARFAFRIPRASGTRHEESMENSGRTAS